MKKYQKEIIKLTAKETLKTIFDLAIPFFSASSVYRISAKKYLNERSIERSNLVDKVYYLKKMGLIDTFIEGKEKYIEITPKGVIKLEKYISTEPIIERTPIWDGKWRVVIFDVPNKHKSERDIFRRRLLKMGFIKIQESVYVYPFECTEIISRQSGLLNIKDNVLIMISDIIQGENKIIKTFIDMKVLVESDIKI